MSKYKKYIDMLPEKVQNDIVSGVLERDIMVKVLKKAIFQYYKNKEDIYYNKEHKAFQMRLYKKRDEYNKIIKELYSEINTL
jgi:predicted AlkP superfamily phosphohydrolase/phosphomutase